MFYTLLIIGLIAAVLLVLVILAQNPKGGINNQLGAGSNVLGVKKTTDILEKATWVLAGIVLTVSVASTKLATGSSKNDIDPNIKKAQSTAPDQIQGDENFDLGDDAPIEFDDTL